MTIFFIEAVQVSNVSIIADLQGKQHRLLIIVVDGSRLAVAVLHFVLRHKLTVSVASF